MNSNILIYYALSFSTVVKAGGFSSAAKKSGISKAQLSRHVSALEALLGIQLLHRTTRSMSLTEQGKQFYLSCETIEENCNEAVSLLKHDFRSMEGTLRITAPIDFGTQFLPSIIHEFSKVYPNINVILELSNINENLTEQAYDLAIRIANRLPDSNLRMLKLMMFKRIICVSPHYLKGKAKPKHPRELKDYHCITSVNRNANNIHPYWQLYNDGHVVNFKLEKFIEVDSLFAQLELIKLGSGIGRLPHYFIQKELKEKKLIELFSNIEKPDTYVYLLYPDVKVLPRKTRIFIDYMKKTEAFT